ncbi:MAG: RNA ligase RtcB family protein [Nitrospinales bacterium]
MKNLLNNSPKIKIIDSGNLWMEGKAIDQLRETSKLPGMKNVVGLPDLHPGKGSPIGAAFLSQGIIYPYLVGSDIGCGMGLWQTTLPLKKIKLDRWVKKLIRFEDPWDGDKAQWLEEENLNPTPFDDSLGTIGGGNHFAELQSVEEIFDKEAFSALNLNEKHLVILAHSGSRGFGHQILQDHIDKFKADGLLIPSKDAEIYFEKHDLAMKWARLNRRIIADRFSSLIGSEINPILDIWHNSVGKVEMDDQLYWLHRKGAAPSDMGPIIIPGSRGTLSYLVKPIGDLKSTNFSLAHGAGRKWNRSECKGRLVERYKPDDLSRTELGGRVICKNKSLLYEEAPQAYKKIDSIIETLLDAKLIALIASFCPVITYKTGKH